MSSEASSKYDNGHAAVLVRHLGGESNHEGQTGSIATSAHPLAEALGSGWRSVSGYILDNGRDYIVRWGLICLVALGVGYYKLSQHKDERPWIIAQSTVRPTVLPTQIPKPTLTPTPPIPPGA